MKKRIFMGLLFMLVVGVAFCPYAEAGKLNWHTDNVYFEGNKLVVDGYFINNTERPIININTMRLTVKVGRNEDTRQIADFTVNNTEVSIEPGETERRRFWTTNAPRVNTSGWNVSVNFRWTYGD